MGVPRLAAKGLWYREGSQDFVDDPSTLVRLEEKLWVGGHSAAVWHACTCRSIRAALVSHQLMHFERHTISDNLTDGYQVIACDVNGDGKQDLIALASGMPELVWFENPTWERHVMATNLPHMINVACWSGKAHSTPTLAVAYEFSMYPRESLGIVSVLTPQGDPRQVWKVTEIDRLPTSHRLRWADIDGTGSKVLINAPLANSDARAPDYRGHVPLVYYRPGEWKRRLIGNTEQGIVHGIFVTDWDDDGREAILIGSFLGINLYKSARTGFGREPQFPKAIRIRGPRAGRVTSVLAGLGRSDSWQRLSLGTAISLACTVAAGVRGDAR